MKEVLMQSKCLKYGNDISTDLIIPGKYTKTLVIQELADHAMEDLDANFKEKVAAGSTIVVAGTYFGCGSSREQAPVALKAAGVELIAAKTFSRIFFRNAVNVGLPIVECDTDRISEGDELSYTVGSDVLKNLTTGEELSVIPLPPIMVEIMACGGITGYFKNKHGF